MTCIVCGWQEATRKGRCNACRLFYLRHGRDKTMTEIQRGWERAFDKANRIVIPAGRQGESQVP